MKEVDSKKIVAYIIILLLVANIVLFAFKLISALLFWVTIIIFAIIAYSGWFKKKQK